MYHSSSCIIHLISSNFIISFLLLFRPFGFRFELQNVRQNFYGKIDRVGHFGESKAQENLILNLTPVQGG